MYIMAHGSMWVVYGSVVFFFFQAEDGIRDYKVTGVQTCALPISDSGLLAQVANSVPTMMTPSSWVISACRMLSLESVSTSLGSKPKAFCSHFSAARLSL